jgi:hypothetical protein
MAFYFAISVVLLHRVVLEADVDPPLSLGSAAQSADQMARNVVAAGIPLFDGFETSPARVHLASDLAAEAQRYVLSHELAHVALGHSASGIGRSMLLDPPIPIIGWSWDQEFDADELALFLTLGPPPGPPRWEDFSGWYAGCDLALDAVAFLEDHRAATLRQIPMATHPPAGGRLAKLRAIAFEACEDEAARSVMFVWADELARLLDEIRVELGLLPARQVDSARVPLGTNLGG